MSLLQKKQEVKIKIDIIKLIQEKYSIVFDRDILEKNWPDFYNSILKLGVLVGDAEEFCASAFKISKYKGEEIKFKMENIAFSDKSIFVTNPFILDDFDFLEKGVFKNKYNIGFISKEELELVEVAEERARGTGEKIKKIISNIVMEAAHLGFSKIEISLKEENLIISKTKNNKKIMHKIKVDNIDLKTCFKSLEPMTSKLLSKDFDVIFINFNNKMTIKINRKNINYLSLLLKDKNSATIESIEYAANKDNGIVIVGSKKGMGKTSFLKGIQSLIALQDPNREVLYISSEDNLNEEIEADVILVDIDKPIKNLKKIINLSLDGALVFVSITGVSSINSLKMIKYKSEEELGLFADQLIGVYHQAIIQIADKENIREVSVFDIPEFQLMLNYKNRPTPNDKILKEIAPTQNIPEVTLVSEWMANDDVIINSLKGNFKEKEILIELRGRDWEDMSEIGLLLLTSKKITINSLRDNLKLF